MATDGMKDSIDDQYLEETNETINIRDMLELQLSEMEMLTSMYPDPNELKIEDPLALHHIRSFLAGNIKYEYLYSRIGFTAYLFPKPEVPCFFVFVCFIYLFNEQERSVWSG